MKDKLFYIAIGIIIVLGGLFFFSACEKDKPMITAKPTVVIKSTSETGVCVGDVTSDGRNEVTSRGFIYSKNSSFSNPMTKEAGKGIGEYTATLDQLSPSTTYYVKAFATNSIGTSYSEMKSFMTPAAITQPVVTINSANALGTSTASCTGSVTSDGGSAVTSRGFQYSTSSSFSNCQTKTVGSGTGSFSVTLTGLSTSTTYFVRAFATNSQGTSYSSQVKSFTTASYCPSSVTDYDGNSYSTVQIGIQCWMKSNLKTTHYADGASISLGSIYSTSTSTPYRYYPNNSGSNVSTYGYLYNWKAVMRNSSSSSSNPSGVQGICPNGWHVPSDAEWTQLTDYVSSQSQYVCGSDNSSIAKALASTTGWNSSTNACAVGNNPGSNNASGFSAVPAGDYSGYYEYFGEKAAFWSSTEYSSTETYRRALAYNNDNISRLIGKKYNGYSVRCIKD